jgi:hypothetical protein
MIRIIYETLSLATAKANDMTKQTGRYWTAIRYDADGWIITDRYN